MSFPARIEAGAPAARDRVLPWRTVREMTGISRTTAWRLQRSGEFPKPVRLSPGRVGWREGDIAAWTANLAPRPAPAEPPDLPHRPPRPAADQLFPQPDPPSPQPQPPPTSARASAPKPRHKPVVDDLQLRFDF